MRRSSLFTPIILFVVLFAPVLPARAAGSAFFALSASNPVPAVGDDIKVAVWVNPNGEAIDTVRANLSFNPGAVEAIWFDLAPSFPSLSPDYGIDNANGTLTFGAYKFGERVTASSLLATVTFRTLAAGSATISVDDTSRLITDGVEKIDAETSRANGTVSLAIGGSSAPVSDKALEAAALVYFGAFAGRMPSTAVEWEALHCMAYDTCYPADVAERNVAHERQSLVVFGAKYAHIPVTAADWRALHAIAYTTIFYDWTAIDAVSGT